MKYDTIVKLADILNCTPSYLLGWEDGTGNKYLKIAKEMEDEGISVADVMTAIEIIKKYQK